MSVEYARRGLVGLLTPQANTTVEPEFSILLPAGYAHINARLVSPAATIEERLRQYVEIGAATCRQFANAPLAAVAFGCTGASYLVGAEAERGLLRALTEVTGVPACTAASAVVDALHALGAQRIALASPYPAALTAASRRYWEAQGFAVTAVGMADGDAAAFHPIYALGAQAAGGLLAPLCARDDTDAVLMLGTGMPTLAPLLAANRADGGPPVLSCMLALAWKSVELIAPGAFPLAGWLKGRHWQARLALAGA